MKAISALKTFMASNAGFATSFSIVTAAGICGAAILYFHVARTSEASAARMIPVLAGDKALQLPSQHAETVGENSTQHVTIPEDKAQSIGLEMVPARRSDWPERLRVTGRLKLNESRVAHVSSLIDGVIRDVPVQLGQTVERGEVLACIDSREVGEAKLRLVKDRLQLTLATRSSKWYQTIHENTGALLTMLQEAETLDEIETAFQDRPVGKYREQLVSALASLKRAKTDFERIRALGADAIIAGKQVIHARAEHEAAEATYQALREQIRFDVHKQALDAQQQLQAAEAAVAISRSYLLILGYSEQDIDSMDPIAEAERVAYYPLRSPIAGTVIAKNATLSQHVDDNTELIEVADLSTVWVQVDVFEKDLQATRGLQGKSVTFEVGSYPGQRFTADIFSLGDLVDDETRAVRLLAIADNSDRLLKPGMFVQIELTPRHDADVLQLPAAAIQRHAGATFVFISDGAGGFARRDVTLGRATSELVEIDKGLAEGESVVVHGGFALKSEMLSEMMEE